MQEEVGQVEEKVPQEGQEARRHAHDRDRTARLHADLRRQAVRTERLRRLVRELLHGPIATGGLRPGGTVLPARRQRVRWRSGCVLLGAAEQWPVHWTTWGRGLHVRRRVRDGYLPRREVRVLT